MKRIMRTAEQLNAIADDYREGMGYAEICEKHGISPTRVSSLVYTSIHQKTRQIAQAETAMDADDERAPMDEIADQV